MTTTNENTTPGTTTNANDTASGAYAANRNLIARLLSALDDELAKHGERAKAAPQNWGFASDLGKVCADLSETLEFLSGRVTTRPTRRS